MRDSGINVTLFLFCRTSVGLVFNGTNWLGSSILMGYPLFLFISLDFIHCNRERERERLSEDGGEVRNSGGDTRNVLQEEKIKMFYGF